jgi:hypothetical protein
MSSGAYALLGVVLGGIVTLFVQGGLSWWQEKRANKTDWLVASRLLSDELLRLMSDMKAMIGAGVIGEGFAEGADAGLTRRSGSNTGPSLRGTFPTTRLATTSGAASLGSTGSRRRCAISAPSPRQGRSFRRS